MWWLVKRQTELHPNLSVVKVLLGFMMLDASLRGTLSFDPVSVSSNLQ